MPTLAPKLPWQHAFAGGYPRRGGQPLPTDPDAIDYLNRVAAANGAAVEVGIAQAIDAFVRGCKADSAGYAGDPTRSNWDSIKASCIMCGARTLSGALVPLKGTAPTPYNFASGDYSRSGATPGLKGNGSTKYLDTNRANNADGQDDNHNAVYVTTANNTGTTAFYIDSGEQTAGSNNLGRSGVVANLFVRNRTSTGTTVAGEGAATGLLGHSRSSSSGYTVRASEANTVVSVASQAPTATSIKLYARPGFSPEGYSDARIAFYSVGSALDLAALDERVTNLVTAIRFHTLTGLLPNDYDPATIAYITAAYAAGGAL